MLSKISYRIYYFSIIIMIIHFAHKLNEKVNRKVIIGNILQMDTGTPT